MLRALQQARINSVLKRNPRICPVCSKGWSGDVPSPPPRVTEPRFLFSSPSAAAKEK